MHAWSEWRPFPDPRARDVLIAPFGPGVYEIRHACRDDKLVLFGIGGHVAVRFSSLLPKPYGKGARNNKVKREYCLTHLADLEYRTLATTTRNEAAAIEREIKKTCGSQYLFGT